MSTATEESPLSTSATAATRATPSSGAAPEGPSEQGIFATLGHIIRFTSELRPYYLGVAACAIVTASGVSPCTQIESARRCTVLPSMAATTP